MPGEIFSIAGLPFRVFRDADASIRWQGDYRGMKVIAALPIDDDSKCLILLDTVASKEPTFENLLCVERDGNVAWKAELPQSHDAFVSFENTAEGLIANTWSGYRVRLNSATGKLIERHFVK